MRRNSKTNTASSHSPFSKTIIRLEVETYSHSSKNLEIKPDGASHTRLSAQQDSSCALSTSLLPCAHALPLLELGIVISGKTSCIMSYSCLGIISLIVLNTLWIDHIIHILYTLWIVWKILSVGCLPLISIITMEGGSLVGYHQLEVAFLQYPLAIIAYER